jgi:hypothetical protein
MPVELKRKAGVAEITEVDLPEGAKVRRINSAAFAAGKTLYLDTDSEFLSDPLIGTVKPVGRLKKEIEAIKYGIDIKDAAVDRQLTSDFSPNIARMFWKYVDTNDLMVGDALEEAKRLTQAYKSLGRYDKIAAASKFLTDPNAPESPAPMMNLSCRPASVTESGRATEARPETASMAGMAGMAGTVSITGNRDYPPSPAQAPAQNLALTESFVMAPPEEWQVGRTDGFSTNSFKGSHVQ